MKLPSRLEKVRDVHVVPSKDVVYIIDRMGLGGRFTAKNLAEAARVLDQTYAKEGCTKFLSFPAAPVATGLRGVLVDMVKNGLVDVVITASSTLDHDVAGTAGAYYHGSFEMDDARLRRQGYHRLGNLLVPLQNYGPLIEKRMQPLLSRIYSAGERSVTTEELCTEAGEESSRCGDLFVQSAVRA